MDISNVSEEYDELQDLLDVSEENQNSEFSVEELEAIDSSNLEPLDENEAEVREDIDDCEDNIECELSESDESLSDCIEEIDENEISVENIEKIDECDMAEPEDLIRDLLDQNVEKQRLLSDTKAEWSELDEKGNSDCILRDGALIKVAYKSDGSIIEYSGEEFKERMRDLYGQDFVSYSHKEPDFLPFEQEINREEFEQFLFEKYGQPREVVEIPESHVTLENMGVERKDTYSEAFRYCLEKMGDQVTQRDLEEFMRSKNLTWHECGDRKTMRMIPSEINQVFKHTGGIGIEKDFRTLKHELDEISRDADGETHTFVLDKESKIGTASGLSDAIEKRHEEYSEAKKNLF